MVRDLRPGADIYLIGICGTAMAALAGMLTSRGYRVKGSDSGVYPPMSDFLASQGIPAFEGYDPTHLEPRPDLVVIGNAVSRGNPEAEFVLEHKLYYASLPEVLKELFIRGKTSVVVTGTHGKTTTSSLIAWALGAAGRDPGFMIGGIPENFGQGYRVGGGPHFVSEGDEYDTAFFDKGPKFLHYLPDLVVVNAVEFDHADMYADLEAVKVSFRRLVNLIPRNGLLLACADDPGALELVPRAFCPVQTFGLADGANWGARDLAFGPERTTFTALLEGSSIGRFDLPLRGEHSVRNALATLASGTHLGLTTAELRDGLSTFAGVRRRLSVRGTAGNVTVIDDFAKHPTEVRETLRGLRLSFPARRIWAVFEPATATARRAVFQHDYPPAFDAADRVVLAPVFRPDKAPEDQRLQADRLVRDIESRGKPVAQPSSVEEIVALVAAEAQPGDLVVCMSNAGFGGIHEKLLAALRKREK